MAIGESELTLDLSVIGDELERQVQDYFSDWEVDDLDEPSPAPCDGRIVYC